MPEPVRPKTPRASIAEACLVTAIAAALAALVLGCSLPGCAPRPTAPSRAAAPTPPPLPTSNGVVVATNHGVVGDGRTENSTALQNLVNAVAPWTTIQLGAGTFVSTDPVIIDKPGVKVVGAGMGLTVVSKVLGNGCPAFIYGRKRTEDNGQVVDATHSPDAYGVLDATVAPAPGRHAGYATRGDTVAVMSSTVASLGTISALVPAGNHAFDYFNEHHGLTVEMCIQPGASGVASWPDNVSLVGVGDQSDLQPAPYCFYAPDNASIAVMYKLQGDNPQQQTTFRTVRWPVDWVKPGARKLAWWINLDKGLTGAWVDGVDVPVTGDVVPPGSRFLKQTGTYPFWLGGTGECTPVNSGPSTDVIVWAYRVSDVARTTQIPSSTPVSTVYDDPGSDAVRYFGADTSTVFYLTANVTGNGRLLQFMEGPKFYQSRLYAWISSTVGGSATGIDGNGISDLTIQGGGPGVMIGSVLDFSVNRCNLNGYTVGLGTHPVMASYPITILDSQLGGHYTALNLYRCTGVSLQRVQATMAGRAHMQFQGCDVLAVQLMLSFACQVPDVGVDMIGHGYGGTYDFSFVDVDNEQYPFASAVVRAANHPYMPTTLFLKSVSAAQVGPGAAYLVLTSPGLKAGVFYPARVSVTAPKVVSPAPYASAVAVQGLGWYGDLDPSQLPKPPAPFQWVTGDTSNAITTVNAVPAAWGQ